MSPWEREHVSSAANLRGIVDDSHGIVDELQTIVAIVTSLLWLKSLKSYKIVFA